MLFEEKISKEDFFPGVNFSHLEMQNKTKKTHAEKEKLLFVPKFFRVYDAYVAVVHVTKTQLFSVKIKGISENEALLMLSAPCVYFNQRFFPSSGMTRGKGSGELFIQCTHQWKRYCNLQLLIVELPLKGLGVFKKYADMKIWP